MTGSTQWLLTARSTSGPYVVTPGDSGTSPEFAHAYWAFASGGGANGFFFGSLVRPIPAVYKDCYLDVVGDFRSSGLVDTFEVRLVTIGGGAPPGASFFTSITINGTTLLTSAASYTSGGSTGIWTWSGHVGLTPFTEYPTTLA